MGEYNERKSDTLVEDTYLYGFQGRERIKVETERQLF
jgi:hypothetical protein